MRPGGGKGKGSAFERKVCRDLSLWMSRGERSDLLWRSAMSGGRATVAGKKGEKMAAQAGDVSGIDLLGQVFINRFTIECKNYKTINIPACIYGGNTGVVGFWEQATKDAASANKLPLLIAKENFKEILMFTTPDSARYLCGEVSDDLVAAVFPHLDMVAFSYNRFLKEVEVPEWLTID